MIKSIKIPDAEVIELNNGDGHYMQIGDDIFAVNGCQENGQPGQIRWKIVPDCCRPAEREVFDYFTKKRAIGAS